MQTSTQSLRATQSLRDYRFRFRRSCASRPHDFLRRTDRLLSGAVNTVLELTVSYLVQWPVEFSFPSVLPRPVAYDNKIEFQIAPPDAQRTAEACNAQFRVRELALAFIARRSPRARSNAFQLTTPLHSLLNANIRWPHRHLIANDSPTRIVILSDQQESKGLSSRSRSLKLFSPRFLIVNLELEFPASRTRCSLLTFSNRKKIAVFDPRPSLPIGEPKKLSLPLAHPDDRPRRRKAANQHISNRNSRFTGFGSTCCKHMPYQISNRNKNAHFAFFDTTNTSRELRVTSYDSRTTTRAAFRSTIPARPHGYR